MAIPAKSSSASAKLADLTNVGILVLLVIVGARYAWSYTHRPVPPLFHKGDTISGVPKPLYTATERTLIVQVRSTCAYCAAAMPFYRDLVNRIRQQKLAVRIIAICGEPAAACEAYLKAHSIPVDVARAELGDRRLAVTPALLLINSTGRVLGVWPGRLSRAIEEEVFTAIGLIPTT